MGLQNFVMVLFFSSARVAYGAADPCFSAAAECKGTAVVKVVDDKELTVNFSNEQASFLWEKLNVPSVRDEDSDNPDAKVKKNASIACYKIPMVTETGLAFASYSCRMKVSRN